MNSASERRAILRFAFLITGYVILFLPRSAFDQVVMVKTWAAMLFQARSPAYYLLLATAHLVLLGAMILCWVTARGLRRSKEWGRWVGYAACALFLPLFPAFTVLGVVGAYFLYTMPPMGQPDAVETIRLAAARSKDYWTAKRQSKLQPVLMFIFTVVIWSLMGFLAVWAKRAGMPVRPLGLLFWLWYSVFLLFQVALHEAGHAIVAWSLFYKVKVISFGPVTVTRHAKGWRWSLTWAKLLFGGGYMGAQPTSERNLRWTEAAVVGAGPATSLLSGLVFLAVFVLLPGTTLQQYWWIAALNATLGIMLGINNLLPVGYSDGSMFFHLVFNTEPGRILLHRLWAGPMEEQLKAHHDRAEFDQQAELARSMLKSAVEAGKGNAMVIAACHQMLASALAPTGDYPAAEAEYRQALEFEAECTVNPALAANTWMGLLRVCARRQRIADVGPVYASALAAIGQRKLAVPEEQRAVSCAMLAQAHFYAANAQGVLDETSEGLRLLPAGPEHMILRSVLLYLQTNALLHLGRTAEGLASSNSGREILLSPQMPAASKNLAADDLGDLANALWSGGQGDLAVERMPEAIQRLEAGGAMCAAASHRIALGSMLRQLGRHSEGEGWLPDPVRLTAGQRRRLVAEQAEVSLNAGRPGEAISGSMALLEMWRAEPYDCRTEYAATEALLARAYFEAADYNQAEMLATRAAEALGPAQHPDAADCLITILLARWETEHQWIPPVVDEARRLIDTAPLLTPAEKQRMLERQMARIKQRYQDAAAAVGQPQPMEAPVAV